MGMAGFQQRSGSIPSGACGLAVCQKVTHAVHQIVPLHDDVAPRSPDGGLFGEGQQVAESLPVLCVQGLIAGTLHVVRMGGSLGVDIEHQEAVIPVGKSDSLGGLQRGIQRVRRGGGGVDADADQGTLPAGSQNVTVFGIGIGDI